MKRIRGVILDLDGTVIDSNDAHAQAWVKAMEEAGYRPDFQEVRRAIGMGGDFLLPRTLGLDSEGEAGRRISRRRKELFAAEHLPRLHPFPGGRELVELLRREGIRTVVGSSSKPEEVQEMLRLAGIEDLVDQVVTAGDVENAKPEPDVVQAGLERLDLPPDRVLMLGDTPYDIEAAFRAGVRTVAVESGGWEAGELEGALAVYRDLQDLLRNYAASPLAL